MRKIYALNARQNNSSFILTGKTGNRVRYNFTNGSVIQNVLATFMTENKYYQTLLEESDYFKRGLVKLKQSIPTEKDRVEAEKKREAEQLKPVEGIKNVKEAILWIAETFGEKVTTGRQAVELARKKGYDLKIEKS